MRIVPGTYVNTHNPDKTESWGQKLTLDGRQILENASCMSNRQVSNIGHTGSVFKKAVLIKGGFSQNELKSFFSFRD